MIVVAPHSVVAGCLFALIAAVLLETGEPEKFVVEVRQKWGGPS